MRPVARAPRNEWRTEWRTAAKQQPRCPPATCHLAKHVQLLQAASPRMPSAPRRAARSHRVSTWLLVSPPSATSSNLGTWTDIRNEDGGSPAPR